MLIQLFLFRGVEQPTNSPVKQIIIPDNYDKDFFETRMKFEHEEIVKCSGYGDVETKMKLMFLNPLDEDINFIKIVCPDHRVMYFPKKYDNLITVTIRKSDQTKIAWKTIEE